MPNQKNIAAPITLVGLGRSGTTLITNIFRSHPQVQSLGETGNAIYSTYYHLETTLHNCGPRAVGDTPVEGAVFGVRAMLQKVFEGHRPSWFHKPILIPKVSRFFPDHTAFVEWYWQASINLFPDARHFTVMRDPNEVLASAITRWNMDESQALAMLDRNYDLLLANNSRLDLVIDFADLTQDPEGTVRTLLDFAGLDFHDRCMKPFERQHAKNKDRTVKAGSIEISEEILGKYDRLLARARRIAA